MPFTADESPKPPPAEAGELLTLYAIYESPRDYPGKIVARRWKIGYRATAEVTPIYVGDDFAEARAAVKAAGAGTNLGRFHDDDPVMREAWV